MVRTQRAIQWSHMMTSHRASRIRGGSSDTRGVSILVVDDRPDTRYAMVRALTAAGFDVRETGTGRDALRLARSPMHLIVLDLVLSDMNGIDVLRRLKSDPVTSDIPVVIKTA